MQEDLQILGLNPKPLTTHLGMDHWCKYKERRLANGAAERNMTPD